MKKTRCKKLQNDNSCKVGLLDIDADRCDDPNNCAWHSYWCDLCKRQKLSEKKICSDCSIK